jgi:shikimate dehydrogenase
MVKEQKLGLIGGESIAKYSVAHLVWREIIAVAKAKAKFEYYPIPTADLLHEKLEQVRSGEIVGVNVALPWKDLAAAQCDIKSPVVAATSYANTIYGKNGKLYADNTDGRGFLRGLDHQAIRQALIFGAGGAGTVLAYELTIVGAKVTLVDIEPDALDKARSIIDSWPEKNSLEILPSSEVGAGYYDLIVNATPLGRGLPPQKSPDPNMQLSPIPEKLLKEIAGTATFAEMNYFPAQTKFLAQGHAMRRPIVPGLAMLLGQAVLSYQDYSGILLNQTQSDNIMQQLEKELFDD